MVLLSSEKIQPTQNQLYLILKQKMSYEVKVSTIQKTERR
jgi:hypothetical protein